MKTPSADSYRIINEVFILGDDIDRQLFNQFSLTVRQYHLLNWLHIKGQASLTELAQLLLCDKSNVTGIVRRLKTAQLIMERPKQDRRFTTVTLTERGRNVHQEAKTALERSIEARFATISKAQHHDIQQLLKQFYHTLRAYIDDDLPQEIAEREDQE